MRFRSGPVLLLSAAVLGGCLAQGPGDATEQPQTRPGSAAAPAGPAPAGPALAGSVTAGSDAAGSAAIAAPGAGGSAVPEIPAVAGQRAWSGQVSAAFNDMTVTAREPRGWDLVWQLVGEPAPGPLPEGAMAVAVFRGSRPTGGYAVDIVGLRYRPDQVLAFYRETAPGGGAVVTQQLTAPWIVRLAPASPLPVHYLPAEER